MIRYALAPHRPAWAAQLGIPLTLPADPARAPADAAGARPADWLPPTPPAAATPRTHTVAITFDDGPHPEGTALILDALARHGAHATFFVVGEQVIARPQLLQRAREEGHAIALHGYRHRLHLRRSAADLREDFARGITAIEDATGHTPTHHRPPYGIYSPASLAIARELQLQPLLWSAWGKDWRGLTTPARIAGRVLLQLADRDVILLHDADFYSARRSHERTAAALETVLTALGSGGFGTVLCA
ncbi:MAG: polysaccharide deacetylase family protein [Solirubrobacteraceae bacterium]